MANIKQLGKYTILEELGHGGFGTVYRANDNVLDREVALKILHPQLTVDMDFIARFKKEARLVARLDHPNIITIYDLGEQESRIFISMRYLPGGSLRDRLKISGRIPYDQAMKIIQQVCAGLEAAHSEGIIHRDIKPENILFSEKGQAVITDFGLAKATQASSSSGAGGVGTPGYRAPELWRGKPPAGPATDEYALACVFVELLTGEQLFGGDTPDEIITKHLVDGAVLPKEWPAGVPEGMSAVMQKALAKDPTSRYLSVDIFLEALQELNSAATNREEAAALQLAKEKAWQEEQARQKAAKEEQARRTAEESLRKEMEAKARLAANEQAQQEELARQKIAKEELSRREAEVRLLKEAEIKTRKEAEEQIRKKAQDQNQQLAKKRATGIAQLQHEIETALAGRDWGKARRLISQLKNLGQDARPIADLLKKRLPKSGIPGWAWVLGSLILLGGIFSAVVIGFVEMNIRDHANNALPANPPFPTTQAPINPSAHSATSEIPFLLPTPEIPAFETTLTIPTATPLLTATPSFQAVFRLDTNVFTGPGKNYPDIHVFPAGTQIQIIGRNYSSEWLFVACPLDIEGWVPAKLVNVGLNINLLPELTPPPVPTFAPLPTNTFGPAPGITIAPP
jgi:hypothetical protein